MTTICAKPARIVKQKRAKFARVSGVQYLHYAAMDSTWFRKRMKAVGVTQDTLGVLLGRDRTAVSRIIGRKRPMRLDEVPIFARALHATEEEILRHAGLPLGYSTKHAVGENIEQVVNRRENKAVADDQELPHNNETEKVRNSRFLQIIGGLSVNKYGYVTISPAAIDYAQRPPDLVDVREAYAIYMFGDSMWPRFRNGDVLYVHPSEPDKADSDVVIKMRSPDGIPQAIIGACVESNTKFVTLRFFNPPGEVTVARRHIEAVHQVILSGRRIR